LVPFMLALALLGAYEIGNRLQVARDTITTDDIELVSDEDP
jgi:hypothetical protein